MMRTSDDKNLFGYYINLDERGVFFADVRDSSRTTVFSIRSEYDGAVAIIDDGFMRHKRDIEGLREYLVSQEFLPAGAELLDMVAFESRLDPPVMEM